MASPPVIPPPPPPPPPPPLALPPPPPPPPPGQFPGGGQFTRGPTRASKMRNFNWEAIPKDTVLGKHNIWTAEKNREFELDTKRMEELFSHNDQNKVQAAHRRSIRLSPSNAPGPEGVSILNSKKNMNIGIFLKQFRRSVNGMIDDIIKGRGEGFGTGKLKELCKLLPEDGEVRQLLAFKGDYTTLSEADQFMAQLVKVPCYEERLNSLVLKEEFPHFMDEANNSIAIMTAAGKELLECVDLHSVIRLVLKTGNYMNSGGYAGSAVGFRMTSLLKLADTKANKPGMNLMHYVVMQAQKIDASLLNFTEQLRHIGDAARIHIQEIETEFQKEVSKVQVSKQNADKQPDLQEQMRDFLQYAETRLQETEASFQTLAAVSESVAEYFCEDPSQFKLEECCSIFYSFCQKFKRAVQENLEREMAEVKRRQRERVQCAAKRRSTATCSVRDKDMEGVAMESVLQRFLHNSSSRRRAGTPSPTQGSISEITSQENHPANNREVKRNSWLKSVLATEYTNKNVCEEETPKPPEITILSPGASTILSINQRVSVTIEQDEEEAQTETDVQNMRELSRRVLRYQSRGSASSGEALSPVQSPRQLVFQEDRKQLLIVSIQENTCKFEETTSKSINTLELLQTNQIINRRHTIALPKASCGNISEEDLFIPGNLNGTPTPRIGSIGKMKSVDCSMLITQQCLTETIKDSCAKPLNSQEESQLADSSQLQSAESEAKTEETVRSLQFGNGKKLNNQTVSPKNTKETFSFMSLFKRWRVKSNSKELDCDSVDP
ncbi:FH2 domain-containing protein 1-like [Myxocyprinus asiaticus]|uniref:FH2 domain-containing protein 1-like n=1 Tax=Myxocyprinus asiaticus TaxID=70543 RepID=UPI002222C2CC|nr:FH2 domain-containing protein 1-like [Myxocyprinus asiaticus]